MTDVYLFICTQRSANDTSESSKVIIYIYLDFIGPHWNIYLFITIRFSS